MLPRSRSKPARTISASASGWVPVTVKGAPGSTVLSVAVAERLMLNSCAQPSLSHGRSTLSSLAWIAVTNCAPSVERTEVVVWGWTVSPSMPGPPVETLRDVSV